MISNEDGQFKRWHSRHGKPIKLRSNVPRSNRSRPPASPPGHPSRSGALSAFLPRRAASASSASWPLLWRMLDHRSAALDRHAYPSGQHHPHSLVFGACGQLGAGRGNWWGLALIGAAFFVSILHQRAELFFTAGSALVSLIPLTLPVYLYGSGIVLLFAGARVWRSGYGSLSRFCYCRSRCPVLTSSMIDIPLQNISARVARDFRHSHPLCAHHPAAPPHVLARFWHVHRARMRRHSRRGHVGIPGAHPRLSQASSAAPLGSICHRWRAPGIPFQLHPPLRSRDLLPHRPWTSRARRCGKTSRLCNRKLPVPRGYYDFSLAREPEGGTGFCRSAGGLERDYFRLSMRRRPASKIPSDPNQKPSSQGAGGICRRAARGSRTAFFGASITAKRTSPNRSVSRIPLTFPKADWQLRAHPRTWYEQSGGQTLVESGAYSAPSSDEIIVAVWVAPFVYYHDANSCWLARGLRPERVTSLPYVTADGNSLNLSTGYYNDGVTDSIVVSVACTPGSCSQSRNRSPQRDISASSF